MYPKSDIIGSFQFRLKAAEKELELFRSGEKYIRMKEQMQAEFRAYERIIANLKKELADAHIGTAKIRRIWMEALDECLNDCEKRIKACQAEYKRMEKKLVRTEQKLDETRDALREWRRKFYEASCELEKEREKNRKLWAQINQNHENSSIPSSQEGSRKKKIANSREKTGRKPGGQPGHPGHRRPKYTPTSEPVLLPPPEDVRNDPDFRKTKRTLVRQVVGIRMLLDVTEYRADVYYNSKTGEHRHAAFPDGVKNDVNYDGSIKAFLLLLNQDCCTSIDKSRKFLSDLTGGRLNISKGMVSRLSHEFAIRSRKELRHVFADLLLSPVLQIDCTNARESSKNRFVYICAAPKGPALYSARRKKGHEGVKGTVAEDYQGTLVHDHDTTFYSYGSAHQECLAHILRYLKASIENEPDRQWNKAMRSLLQEMIHYRNGLPDHEAGDPKTVADFERRFRSILEQAEKEYEDIPAGDYYRDGFNLYRRMKKDPDSYLLFLHDPEVPFDNNLSERLLRCYKRKQAQAVSFRSFESLEDLCDCMSMLFLMRKNGETNLFNRVSAMFG